MLRGKAVSDDVRKIIIYLNKKNYSTRKIANIVKIPHSSVHDIIKLYSQTKSVQQKKRYHQKSSVNSADIVSLKGIVLQNRRAHLDELAQ